MDIRTLVGLNVQRLRQETGWSQEELAFQSQLHRTYVSGVERGKLNPTVVVLDTRGSRAEVRGPRTIRQ